MNKNSGHPMNKAMSILYIYDELNTGVCLTRKTLQEKFQISEKTVGRYINDVNRYLQEERSGKEVIFESERGEYKLCQKYDDTMVLQQKDILVLTKILLESRGLNYEETHMLIKKLMHHCDKENKSFIMRMIGNEMGNYTAPKHEKKLIEQIWDIHTAIKEQQKLEILYHRIGDDGIIENQVKKRIVYPQAVLFCEYYFYLCADIEGKEYDYPTIFRIDRIEDYQILKEHFRINYSQRFQEGEFRKLTQFMYTGELQTVKFKFFGRSLEAVLDRLPTAMVVQTDDDSFIIKARVFGQGILMWLLSQGENVEVLEPIDVRDKMEKIIQNMLKLYE